VAFVSPNSNGSYPANLVLAFFIFLLYSMCYEHTLMMLEPNLSLDKQHLTVFIARIFIIQIIYQPQCTLCLKKHPTFDLLKSWRTRSNYNNFWQKCYEETKKSDDALFSHLTYLVVLHYLAKQETQKLRFFTSTLYVALPTNTQNTFKLSPGHCWITFIPKVIDRLYASDN